MFLTLIRHGDAHAGFHGPISGPLGCRGLTDLGRGQAELLRQNILSDALLEADVLVTSMLPRAIETAQIIAPALGFGDAERDCGLCEVHTGEADGVDWSEYGARFGSFDMAGEPDRPFAPGGDSWNSFHFRVDEVLTRLASTCSAQRVVAVTSAGVIAASLRLRFGNDLTTATRMVAPRMVPTNTGITEWEVDDASSMWTLRSYDKTVHLSRADH